MRSCGGAKPYAPLNRRQASNNDASGPDSAASASRGRDNRHRRRRRAARQPSTGLRSHIDARWLSRTRARDGSQALPPSANSCGGQPRPESNSSQRRAVSSNRRIRRQVIARPQGVDPAASNAVAGPRKRKRADVGIACALIASCRDTRPSAILPRASRADQAVRVRQRRAQRRQRADHRFRQHRRQRPRVAGADELEVARGSQPGTSPIRRWPTSCFSVPRANNRRVSELPRGMQHRCAAFRRRTLEAVIKVYLVSRTGASNDLPLKDHRAARARRARPLASLARRESRHDELPRDEPAVVEPAQPMRNVRPGSALSPSQVKTVRRPRRRSTGNRAHRRSVSSRPATSRRSLPAAVGLIRGPRRSSYPSTIRQRRQVGRADSIDG